MNATLQSWARALGGEVCGEQVLCPGPGHSSKDRSLAVTIGRDGQPVTYSFCGDDAIACKDYVRTRLGMEPYRGRRSTYEFRNPATGEIRYQKERVESSDGSKSFFFKPPGRNGNGPLLYGGERLADVSNDQPVFIVEGEKKVDRLRELGAIAVSGDSGASSKWSPPYAELLRGLNVVLWPDSDEAGEKYAARAADCLRNSATSLRVVRPFGKPNGKKGRDVCDWQGNVDDLAALVARSEPFFSEYPTDEIITRRASDVAPEPISWVWKYWMARGKFQIIGGVPETGKTTIAMSYAAIVTSGSTWPDGTRAVVGNVLIWTSEDSPADTLVPRLTRMGADLDRVYFIEQARPIGGKPRPFNPAIDMSALVAEAAAIGGIVMLVLDPVVAAMPMGRDSHNNAEARNGMQPVVDFAKESNAAVIGIGHLTKGTAGKDPLERLNGSVAFGALARLVMGAAKNEAEGDDEPERIMVRIKSNIGPSGGGFGYHIDAAPLYERPDIIATRIVWEHELDGTARELLHSAEGEETGKAPKFGRAKCFLTDFLSYAKRSATEIEAAAQNEGISWRTVRRASEEMKIRKFREGGKSWWQLT